MSAMERTAEAVLNRVKEGILEETFRAYVYEHARAESVENPHFRLHGTVVVSKEDIENCLGRPEVAFDSLVRVKLLNLAESFAKNITPDLAEKRRGWKFAASQSGPMPPLSPEAGITHWYLPVWWHGGEGER